MFQLHCDDMWSCDVFRGHWRCLTLFDIVWHAVLWCIDMPAGLFWAWTLSSWPTFFCAWKNTIAKKLKAPLPLWCTFVFFLVLATQTHPGPCGTIYHTPLLFTPLYVSARFCHTMSMCLSVFCLYFVSSILLNSSKFLPEVWSAALLRSPHEALVFW